MLPHRRLSRAFVPALLLGLALAIPAGAQTGGKASSRIRIVNDPGSQPVYVHCVGGRHRTGVMTAIHRMNDDRWTADRALAEMKQYRFGADFLHQEFKEFVYRYHPDLASPLQAALVARSGT